MIDGDLQHTLGKVRDEPGTETHEKSRAMVQADSFRESERERPRAMSQSSQRQQDPTSRPSSYLENSRTHRCPDRRITAARAKLKETKPCSR